MASIHKNLILDHMYFSVTSDELEDLKKIFLKFECSTHQVVNADDASWEGVYIFTRGQNYIEFLKERRRGGIGICQKAWSPMRQDARHITSDFPDLPWKTFERTQGKKKWYTAISCGDYLNLSTYFNTWVMYYPQVDIEHIFPSMKFEISRFNEIHVSANSALREEIQSNSIWLNAKRKISKDKAEFDIETYYGDSFKLYISFDRDQPGFSFKRASLRFEPDVQVQELRLKHFSFFKQDNEYVLELKS